MNSHSCNCGWIRRLVLFQVCTGFGLSLVHAQAIPVVAMQAAQLAKYDRNKNGVLDPDEMAAMQSDEAKTQRAVSGAEPDAAAEAVQLSPFEVVADTR